MATSKSSHAARFTRRFSTEQKDALLRSILVDGNTVAEAQRLARNGRLGVPAFDIGTYAYRLVKDNRDAFEARDDDALDNAVADELHKAEIDALKAIRAARKGLKTGEANTTRLATVARDLAQIRKARRDATKPREPQQNHATKNHASQAVLKTDATLQSLLNIAKPDEPEPANPNGKVGAEIGSLARASNGAPPATRV